MPYPATSPLVENPMELGSCVGSIPLMDTGAEISKKEESSVNNQRGTGYLSNLSALVFSNYLVYDKEEMERTVWSVLWSGVSPNIDEKLL